MAAGSRVSRWIGRLAGAAVLAAVLVVAATVLRVWQVGREDAPRRSDAIVVLGAAQFNGRPSQVFQARLQHALALYQQRYAARIVTVGGNQAKDNYTEAGAGAMWLHAHGVPSSALTPVGSGRDTLQSMRAAAKVFHAHGWHSAIVVTDPWHELRSAKMASDQGLSVTTSPVHSGPAVATRGTELRYIGRETLAYLYYRAFHSSSEAGPNAV